jgi:acetyl-CoA carboxylase alpha subunit
MSDWRDALLAGVQPLSAIGGSGGDAVRVGHGRIGRADVVVAAWDFSSHGGSFGAADATAFATACAEAAATRRPLVSLLRTGGTRLQEGMRALVGLPRSVLALEEVARAGVPHISVADHPTTGGVWVAIGSVADLRVGVAGATVGFSGPRVVEAMTGVAVARGSNTAELAADAGLLDMVVAPEELASWLEWTLLTLRPDDPQLTRAPSPVGVPDRTGWRQVEHSRSVDRPAGSVLAAALVDEAVPLHGGDDSVSAMLGRVHGHRVVAVALAARRGGRPTPAGYRLLTRAADLAARLDLVLLGLVDTVGADPLPVSERGGIAPAIGTAMKAVLACRAPTIAVVHGEGGSGGALAAAVTDVVALTEHGWFAALAPEGAAATLRITPAQAAELMALAPRDLLGNGFADALAPSDPAALQDWVATTAEALRRLPADERLARRRLRWSRPLSADPLDGDGPESGSPDGAGADDRDPDRPDIA